MPTLDKRAAVFGYRLRFSPEIQPIRQTVVDHIILKNIRESDRRDGESAGRLSSIFIDKTRVTTLSIDETKASLERLEKEGLVAASERLKKKVWLITPDGEKKLKDDESIASKTINKIIKQLFGTGQQAANLQECFTCCLSAIFDRLAKSYLDTIIGSQNVPIALSEKILEPIIQRTLEDFPEIDNQGFKIAIGRFFREVNPAFDWLKWTFCQNYYLVRAIGLGESSDVLSKKIYEGATFYLDTNVIIDAFDSKSPHNDPIKHVLNCFQRIDCKIEVLRITLDELKLVATSQKENLKKVLSQIPDALLPKVRGLVARAEAAHRRDPSTPSPSDVLSRFERPDELLLSELGIEIRDDEWFDKNSQSKEVVSLSNHLKKYYNTTTIGRKKTEAASQHDALALKWIDFQRKKQQNCNFITFDVSLPAIPQTVSLLEHTGLAMSIYAVLPWLGSVAVIDEDISKTYSASLSAQLLTLGTQFSIQEFRLLAELEMDCGQLPAEDVEQCLLYLRREAKNLNVSRAEDREKLHFIVKGFFAAPDRKYIAEMSSLHGELAQKEQKIEQILSSYEEEKQNKREQEEKYRRQILQAQAKLRLTVVGLSWLFLIIICFIAAYKYGAGENALQKIGNFWWLFGLVSGAALVVGRWLCRGKLWSEAKELLSFLGKD